MTRDYSHIMALVAERPWAILPSTLAIIRGLMADRLAGARLDEDEISERLAIARAEQGARQGQQTGAVAVIPLYGAIVPKGGLMADLSGATSVTSFMGQLRTAMADPDVGSIVIDVDSPGGLTDLIPEAAAELRAMRGQGKRIVAVANTMMASAAYWLASQADEVIATPSALVGSIGVYTVHEDLSAAYEQAGIKSTLISAGKHKAEGNDLGPLDEDARAHVQALVDEAYAMFTADVAKGRGVKPAAVRGGYGEGRVLTATMAKAEGLIDRVGTLDETIGRMLPNRRPVSTGMAAWVGSPTVNTSHTVSMEYMPVPEPDPIPDPDPVPDPPELDPDFAFEAEKYARRVPA